MDTHTLGQIGALVGTAGAVLGFSGFMIMRYESRRLMRTRMALEDQLATIQVGIAPQYLDDVRPAFRQGDTQTCGGCGLAMTQQELDACRGKNCTHYVERRLQAPLDLRI